MLDPSDRIKASALVVTAGKTVPQKLKSVLEAACFTHVVAVDSQAEAQQWMDKHRFDCVITDAKVFDESSLGLIEKNQGDVANVCDHVSHKYEKILNHIQTIVIELDDQFRVQFANAAWTKLLDVHQEQTLDQSFRSFISPSSRRKFKSIQNRLNSVMSGDSANAEFEVELLSKKGKIHLAEVLVTPSVSRNSSSSVMLCINDVSHRKIAQEQLQYLAMHDSLTGLYNRHYFETLLAKLTQESSQTGLCHGLIYIDLDFFKVINDTFGHPKGDEVLREVSQIIRRHGRDKDGLCRIGGDEFAVLLRDVKPEDIHTIANRFQNDIGQYSFKSGTQTVNLGCSIGVSFIDGSSERAEEYLMQADVALYVAKRRGRNKVHVYNPNDSEGDELRDSVDWSRKIRMAMSDDRMVLHVQPILDIGANEVAYFEMLIRMQDEQGELVMPGHFIPALENTGEMVALDRWVIERGISMLKAHPQLKKIAINLSAQTYKDESLVPMIRECIGHYEVDPKAVVFELTESASLFNIQATRRVVDELHEIGCAFAIDDFGSGFSSFAYLKELPADFIKLDGSFIRNLDNDKVDQMVVRSIIEVVKTLGRKTVAEFVENNKILQFLSAYGVDYAQGYHISRPMPVEEISKLLNNMNANG